MDIYTQIARQSAEKFVKTGQTMEIPQDLPDALLLDQKGVFVTIYRKENGTKSLRGCIGTIHPTRPNVAEEIIQNAIWTVSEDYRFNPVQQSELDNLEYEVSLLQPATKISSKRELDAKHFGVIVESEDGRKGLLLPDIEGIDSAEEQIAIACQKGDISPEEDFDIYKFKVDKHA